MIRPSRLVRRVSPAASGLLRSLFLATAAHAAGSSMPWEEPLEQILESIEGPVAKIIAVIIMVVNLIVDLLYAVINPRVRVHG